VGYGAVRRPDLLRLVNVIDAHLLDTRHSPHSTDPQWTKAACQATFGKAYRHMPALGNRNYGGGEIQIADLPAAIAAISDMIQRRPVILMCACWHLDSCHRKVAADAISAALGCEVVHLDKHRIAEIAPPPVSPTQLPLF
jgi:hypothetical protein